AVIIMCPDQLPALVGLALDVGLGRLALGIKRVEVLFEPVLGGFAGIDGATQDLALVSHRGASPASCRSSRACQKTVVRSNSYRGSHGRYQTGCDRCGRSTESRQLRL